MLRTCPVLVVLGLVAACPPRQVAAPPGDPTPPPAAPEAYRPAQPELRLPRHFLPTGYAARLAIDPARDELSGSIEIAGTLDRRSAVIWLHGHKLAVQRAVATNGTIELPVRVTPRGEDLLELVPARPLAQGTWTLRLDYAARFDLVSTTGAFKQTIGDASYVYTQLEAVYARRVFPCFDEPDAKVPWRLTLDVPAHLVAVGNAPIAREVPLDAGHKRIEFAATKPLPSYLVAFGVGPFEVVDAGTSKRGTPVRVLTLAKRSADAAYAAKTSARVLDLAEDWFGTPYPYEKLDMLTIPLTVGFGAMENAGLITFTETLILHDAQASKSRLRRWIVVAAHEVAHQWFGNLVTMAFWDDIWLNEGFANWVETKITTRFDPTWRDAEAELDVRNGALGADSLVSARQIRQPIVRPDDILNVFDGITYNKGASVLAMFERFVGPDVFQRGVRAYLAARAWGNATSTDFAAAIAKAAGNERLVAAFATFLEQPGAPALTATLACDGAPRVTLRQERYLAPGAPAPAAGRPWIVPVCVAYDRDGQRAEACTLLDAATGTLALDTRTCPRWLMPNVDGRGYYRATYTPAQLAAVRDEAWAHLTWTERRAVYFDATAAASTGRLPLQLGLSLIPRMLAGNDRFTVPPAIGLATGLDDHIPTALRPRYEHWLRATFGPGALALGWLPRPGDGLDDEAMRSALIGGVAWTGREPALVDEAVKLAARWRDLPQAIRGLVLAVAVDAKAELFDQILRDVGAERDRGRRQEMYAALASVRDVGRHRRALAKLLDREVDLRETLPILYGAGSPATEDAARAFLRAHQAELIERLPKDGTTDSIADLSWLFTTTCKADQRDQIAALVTKAFAGYPGGAHVVAQNIEAMDQCIARRALIAPEIAAWLGGLRLPKVKK